MEPSSNDQRQQLIDTADADAASSHSSSSPSSNHLPSRSSSVTSSPALNSNSYCYDETSLALCLQWLEYKDVLAASGVCQAWRAAAGRHDILSSLHAQSRLFISILAEASIDRVLCTLCGGSSSLPGPTNLAGGAMFPMLRASPLMRHVPRVIIDWLHETGTGTVAGSKDPTEKLDGVELNVDANRTTRFQRLVKQVFDDVATLDDVNEISIDARFLLLPAIATHPLLSRAKKLTIDLPQDWEDAADSDAESGAQPQPRSESESVSAVVQHVPTSTSPSASSLSPFLHTTLSHCSQLTKLHIGEMLKPGSIPESFLGKQYHLPIETCKIRQLLVPTPTPTPPPIHQLETNSRPSLSRAPSVTADSPSNLESFSAFCLTESGRHVVISLLATASLANNLRDIDLKGHGVTSKQLAEICRGGSSEITKTDGSDNCCSDSSSNSGDTLPHGQLGMLEKFECVLDIDTSAPLTHDSHAALMEDVSWVALLPRLRYIQIKPRMKTPHDAFTLAPLMLALKRHHQHSRVNVERNDLNGDGDGNGNGNGNGSGVSGDEDESGGQLQMFQYLHEVSIQLPQPPPTPSTVTSHQAAAEHSSSASSHSTSWTPGPFVHAEEMLSLPTVTAAAITLTPAGPSAAILNHQVPNLRKLVLHMSANDWRACIAEYVERHFPPPQHADEQQATEWLRFRSEWHIARDEENEAFSDILQRWIQAGAGHGHGARAAAAAADRGITSGNSNETSRVDGLHAFHHAKSSSYFFPHLTALKLTGWIGSRRYYQARGTMKKEHEGAGVGDPEHDPTPVESILPVLTSCIPSIRVVTIRLGYLVFTHQRDSHSMSEDGGAEFQNGKTSNSSSSCKDTSEVHMHCDTRGQSGWKLDIRRLL